jgi:hypothetical protein
MKKVIEGIKMGLSIHRVYCGDDSIIRIEIEDDEAAARFLEIDISLEEFAQAVTGLSIRPCVGVVRGLERVGKKHEHKQFEFEIPSEGKYERDNKEIARKAVEKVCPKGWIPDTSFNSQHTFFEKDGKMFARTTIRRWV